jgi:hypothetical protein
MLQTNSAPAHLNSSVSNPFGQFNNAPLDLTFTPNNPAFFATANYGISPLDGQNQAFGMSPLGTQSPLVPCSMAASEGILGKYIVFNLQC